MKELTPELESKNLALGWALFGIALLLFAGTIGDRAPLLRARLMPPRKIEIRGSGFRSRKDP